MILRTELSRTERIRRRYQCVLCAKRLGLFRQFDLVVIPIWYVRFFKFTSCNLMYSQCARAKVVHVYCTLCFA